MTLRYKFVLPINLILVLVLLASLAWEWRRQEATGLALLRARLDEEARFVEAAYRSFGTSGRFGPFLHAFCHASDASASPEHQVAVVDAPGSRTVTPSPVRNAFGGHVIGSTAMLRRATSGSWSPVNTITEP